MIFRQPPDYWEPPELPPDFEQALRGFARIKSWGG
jgi:hypothetical protein